MSTSGTSDVGGESAVARGRARISLAEWHAAGGSFTHRGHRIYTRSELGSGGEALVLIHGFPTASWDWEAMWPERARRLRSVAFLNGGLFQETHRPVLIQRLLLSPLGQFIARQTSRARMARNMRSIFSSGASTARAGWAHCSKRKSRLR